MTLFKPAALALILAAGPAMAGSPGTVAPTPDAIAPAPAAPIALAWSGAYAGLQLGHVEGHQRWLFPGIATQNVADPIGYELGAFVGYNWQRGERLVFGIEAEINATRARFTSDMVDLDRAPIPGNVAQGRSELSMTSALRLRMGVQINRSLAYVAAGAAMARHRLTWLDNGVVRDVLNQNRTGYTVAAGLERAMNDRWRLRGEVRYTDFGTPSYAALPGGTPASTSRLIMTEVRVGLAYRF